MFYLNWEEQVDLMDDVELRRFIKNMFRFHRGEEVELPTRIEKLTWLGIVKALEVNQDKYEKKCAANNINAKLGGAPPGNQNASKSKTTQNNLNNPINEKREQTIDKSKKVKEKREKLNENWEQKEDESKKVLEVINTRNTGAYSGKYPGTNLLEQEIDEINHNINKEYFDARPEGKDVVFKGYVKQKLQEKILSTGLFKPELFENFNAEYIKLAKQRLTQEEYKSVEPLLLEYIQLVYSYLKTPEVVAIDKDSKR